MVCPGAAGTGPDALRAWTFEQQPIPAYAPLMIGDSTAGRADPGNFCVWA
jgi:hypothetical protein